MRITELRALVDEQAEDDGLWFDTRNITEAYLQQELRRLHAAIEAVEPSRNFAPLREAEAAAPPGPWGWTRHDERQTIIMSQEGIDFVCAAREHVADLLAAYDEALAHVERLRAHLAEHQVCNAPEHAEAHHEWASAAIEMGRK